MDRLVVFVFGIFCGMVLMLLMTINAARAHPMDDITGDGVWTWEDTDAHCSIWAVYQTLDHWTGFAENMVIRCSAEGVCDVSFQVKVRRNADSP